MFASHYHRVHQNRAGIKRVRRPRDLRESCEMFNEAFEKVFLAKRPWLRKQRTGFMGHAYEQGPKESNRGRPANEAAERVAVEYLSRDHHPRGSLLALCRERGVNYHTVRKYLLALRAESGRTGRRAA